MDPITRTHTPTQVVSLFQSRYTAKSYDPNRVVEDADLQAILEAIRLSPSSMGLEPWKVVVATPGPLVDEIAPLCWGAHPSPSHWLFFLGRNAESFTAEDEVADSYVTDLHVRIQGRGEDTATKRREHVRSLLENDLSLGSRDAATGWVDRQVFLALGSAMLASAMLGVDSTAIEGLEAKAVERVLVDHGLCDPSQYHFVVGLTLGYTDRAQHRDKRRRPLGEVVTVVDAGN
ncbi:MAG: nitroreductase family protein [Actinomycetaceae bacterium]|nr:nitroreductase family protein [Actinomycetaceae bacterium]